MEKNQYSHKHYTYVKDEKDADAVAWVFLNKDDFIKFPFKFEKLGDEELRVNVIYSGLCQSDVLTVRGHWGGTTYPIAPGHEIVGIVSQVGSAVKNIKVGDRVAYGPFRNCCDECRECKRSHDNLCRVVASKEIYGEYWGGYSTAIQHPAKFAFKVPESLPSDKTPPILCAGVTVHAPLARYAKPGDRVAVIGIGGLGHMAVQYANKMGCYVTALSSSKDKEEFIKKELGAHQVISSTDPAELEKFAHNYDVIINTLAVVDSKLFGHYLNLTAGNGVFVQVGAPPVDKKIQIGAFQIISHNINFAGSEVGSRKETNACLEFSALHNILPFCEFFGFDDFPKAFDKLENGRPKFRCVVNVEEWSKKNGFYKQ